LGVLLPLMRQLSLETEAVAGQGLTMAQYRLLAALSRRVFAAGELATYLGVAASTVSGLLVPLVRRGLVERHQTASDRRMVAIRLTESGRHCYVTMEGQVHRYLDRLFGQLTPEAKRALLIGLDELNGVLPRWHGHS
jgi:DNA-binding MarR family transcriptional regulator